MKDKRRLNPGANHSKEPPAPAPPLDAEIRPRRDNEPPEPPPPSVVDEADDDRAARDRRPDSDPSAVKP
ncbi:MAG: hypothetical protein WC809_14665 [Sinimarinibacterium sp.]|jgi:hypothetical protein